MPFWEKTKTNSKAGFDKVYAAVDKLGAPINRLSNRLGSEAFWPTTLDKESDKAARILRSFCKDGFYQEEAVQPADGPQQKQKVLKKIPIEVIRNAKGLAIFTTMRTGLWISGAGGSGVLVGRLEDGTWSPPSGIMLHTAGLGFLIGVDIYDCVVVINTYEALQAFSKVRCTLGTEISAVAGPVGIGGVLETEVHKRQAPIFTYLKSRGFYAGLQVDGTIVIERTDENERFYGERLSVADILGGKVRIAPFETRRLLETLRAAQGDTDIDETLLPDGLAPADHEIAASSELDQDHVFGIPDKDDPDPFGVLALEKAGLEIREAGSRARPSSEMFSFAPSPTSPIYSSFSRRSVDARSISGFSSRPASQLSFEHRPMVQMSDMSTQTDFDGPSARAFSPRPKSPTESTIPEDSEPHDTETPATSRSSVAETLSLKGSLSRGSGMFSPKPSIEINGRAHSDDEDDLANVLDAEVVTPTAKIDIAHSNRRDSKEQDIKQDIQHVDQKDIKSDVKDTQPDTKKDDKKEDEHDDSEDSDDDDDDQDFHDLIEEPVVQQVVHSHTASTPQIVSRPRLVVVNKPAAPKLPPRSPFRAHVSMPPPTRDEDSQGERSPSPPKNRHSIDSSVSPSPSVDSISSSIAKLRALNESPSKEVDNVSRSDIAHDIAAAPAPSSPAKEK